jgi:hypothetical protein
VLACDNRGRLPPFRRGAVRQISGWPLTPKQGSLTLVATGAKLVSYAPGRMTAAETEGRDTSKLGSQCFVFLVCPKAGVILSETP